MFMRNFISRWSQLELIGLLGRPESPGKFLPGIFKKINFKFPLKSSIQHHQVYTFPLQILFRHRGLFMQGF